MSDVLFLAIVIAFFALTVLVVKACGRRTTDGLAERRRPSALDRGARLPRVRAPRAGETRMTDFEEVLTVVVLLLGIVMGFTVLVVLLRDLWR